MKNACLAILLLLTMLSSCKKENSYQAKKQPAQSSSLGCIEQVVIPPTAHSINSADIPVINALFLKNQIDNSTYRYYQYLHQTQPTYFPPNVSFDDKVVKVDEYANGLRIFTGQLVFVFRNDVFNFQGGEPTRGTSLNTTSRMQLLELRDLMMEHIEHYDQRSAYYQDSCFKAEFGYFNINAGTSYSNEKLVKAWRVTLKNAVYPSEYPIAYIQDDDGKLIYYSNGIVTFHE